jgi:hypothetical protein
MATNLLNISKKLYDSQHKAKSSQMGTFLEAATAVVAPIMAESKVKTEAFISAIPADFNMAKVPPELRDKLKNYATNAKAEYSQAAKDAGRFDSTDPRYQTAVDKMNEIRTGFENLLGDITHIKTFRDNALENSDSRSKSVKDSDYLFQDSLLRGDAFADMTIGSDGISIMKDGEVTNIKNILENQIVDNVGSAGLSQINNEVLSAVVGQDTKFDYNGVRNKVLGLFNTMKPKGGTAFAYDGLLGDNTNQSSFIDKYITEDRYLGIKKYDANGNMTKEYEDKYEELKDPANFGVYKNEFISHIMETMENVHNGRVNEYRAKDNRALNQKREEFDKPYIYGPQRSKKDIDDMNSAITARQGSVIGFSNREYKYRPSDDKYEFDGKLYTPDEVRIQEKIHGYKTEADDAEFDIEARRGRPVITSVDPISGTSRKYYESDFYLDASGNYKYTENDAVVEDQKIIDQLKFINQGEAEQGTEENPIEYGGQMMRNF